MSVESRVGNVEERSDLVEEHDTSLLSRAQVIIWIVGINNPGAWCSLHFACFVFILDLSSAV